MTSGWELDLLEIRAGRGFVLHNSNGSGLTAFPSYHCVAGLLFLWAVWPMRRLRIPAAIAALLLIAATPIFGGHYIADLCGGLLVAVLSTVAAHWLEKVWDRRYKSR
jgi:membrane-associated phospholipid phosphatase